MQQAELLVAYLGLIADLGLPSTLAFEGEKRFSHARPRCAKQERFGEQPQAHDRADIWRCIRLRGAEISRASNLNNESERDPDSHCCFTQSIAMEGNFLHG